jgi:hypothetical protein
MSTDTAKALEAEIAGLTQEEAALTAQITKHEAQVAALTATMQDKRRAAQEAYRDANAKTFDDVDVTLALTGATVRHAVTIGKAAYIIAPPKGEFSRAVNAFVLDPVDTSTDKKVDLGPVIPEEAVLLKWLVEVELDQGGQKHKRSLLTLPLPVRLRLIRDSLELVMNKVAMRCISFESFLNVCLELDLGKS